MKNNRILYTIPSEIEKDLCSETVWEEKGGKQAVINYYLKLGIKCAKRMESIKNELSHERTK